MSSSSSTTTDMTSDFQQVQGGVADITNIKHISGNDVQSFLGVSTEPQAQAQLLSLPNEILQKIMYELDEYREGNASEVALGLTCMRFYNLFKLQRSVPICDRQGGSYTNPTTGTRWEWKLQSHIAEFLGPNYRFRRYIPRMARYQGSDTPFLNREIYGDGLILEQAERDYNNRWYDHKHWGRLPSPFGKGEEWYEAVFPRLHKHVVRFETEHKRKCEEWHQRLMADWELPEDEQVLRLPWKFLSLSDDDHPRYHFYSYGKYMEWAQDRERVWEKFEDWCVLIGF